MMKEEKSKTSSSDRSEKIEHVEANKSKKDYRNLIIIVLSILALSGIGAAAYLYYQNAQLQGDIDDMEVQITTLNTQITKFQNEDEEKVGENITQIDLPNGDVVGLALPPDFTVETKEISPVQTEIAMSNSDGELLAFIFPDGAFPTQFESMELIDEREDESLYRVIIKKEYDEAETKDYYYTMINNDNLEGMCLNEDLTGPGDDSCGWYMISMNNKFYSVVLRGDDIEMADKIMKSIMILGKTEGNNLDDEIDAFENQKEYRNKDLVIRYPDTWSVEEQRGGDGMATVINPSFPVYIPESDTVVAIVSGASPSDSVLDHPENAVGSSTFVCNGSKTFKSEVNDTLYMLVEVEDPNPGTTYFVCESNDGGETFALPELGEYAFMYRVDDEKFEEDALMIIKYSERL